MIIDTIVTQNLSTLAILELRVGRWKYLFYRETIVNSKTHDDFAPSTKVLPIGQHLLNLRLESVRDFVELVNLDGQIEHSDPVDNLKFFKCQLLNIHRQLILDRFSDVLALNPTFKGLENRKDKWIPECLSKRSLWRHLNKRKRSFNSLGVIQINLSPNNQAYAKNSLSI